MKSGRTERNNEYDKRTVFGCTPGACASGSNGARYDFDLLWSWLAARLRGLPRINPTRSEEHTSELQSLRHLVCRLLLENDTATAEIYTLSLHDALPICNGARYDFDLLWSWLAARLRGLPRINPT